MREVLVRLDSLNWKQNVMIGLLSLFFTLTVAGIGWMINLLSRLLSVQ